MKSFRKLAHLFLIRFSIIVELFGFLWKNKLWWGIPVISLILLFMLVLLLGQGTGLAPFIYPLF